MATERLKICPRCGGNMFMDREEDEYYEECLQCSYSRELSGIAVEQRGRSIRTEKKLPVVEEDEFSPGRLRSKYSWIKHEPTSPRDKVKDSGNGDNMEPGQEWQHPPPRIYKRLKKIGAKLLYFGSE